MLHPLRLPADLIAALESAAVPPVPGVLLRLLEAVEDENVSAETLGELVARDPVIAARVLSAANSAAYRRGKPFIRLEDCVQVLGTRLIRTIATCLAVQQSFEPLAGHLQTELSGFWHHSMRVAETARQLAHATRLATAEEAFLGGLLHDLGELLLLYGLAEYGAALSMCPDEAALPQLEQLLFGQGHAAAGAWLAEQWRLDSTLADAIHFHHCDADEIAAADPLSRVVWVAHRWVDSAVLPDSDAALLGHSAAQLGAILSGVDAHVAGIAVALGIGQPETTARAALPRLSGDSPPPSPRNGEIDAIVRNLALLQSLQGTLGGLASEQELYLSLRESARLLFGFDKLAWLVHHPDSAELRAASDACQPPQLHAIALPLSPALGLAAQALDQDRPCCSADRETTAALSVGDLQLMRALDAEILVCLPMRVAGRKLGVMTIGLSQARREIVGKQMPWLLSFASLAAMALIGWQNSRRREEAIENAANQHFERQARRAAHEVGNPLGIIRNYLALIERKLPDAASIRTELTVIGEEVGRVSKIVDQLVEAPGDATRFELNALIRELLAAYQPALLVPRNIELVVELSKTPIPLAGNPDALRQIVLNLVKNASVAMRRGGRLVVATSAEVLADGRRYAELRIADNGPGLPVSVRERLANRQPQQPPHAAHGIGLEIVADLVKGLNGNLICHSRPDNGTIFSILIPHEGMRAPPETQ